MPKDKNQYVYISILIPFFIQKTKQIPQRNIIASFDADDLTFCFIQNHVILETYLSNLLDHTASFNDVLFSSIICNEVDSNKEQE